MAITREAVSLGRAIRTMHNLKIRQPLSAIHLVTRDDDAKRILREMEDIIREELNVKEVVFRENEEELVEYTAKANFRELGPRLGKRMRAAAALIEALSGEEIQQLMDGSMLSLDVEGDAVEITGDSVIVQRHEKEDLKVLNEGALTVALDPTITEELRQEGLVRDLIRGVQNLRKESGLDVTDRIALSIAGDDTVVAAAKRFDDYLCGETLTEQLSWEVGDGATEIDLGDHSVHVTVTPL